MAALDFNRPPPLPSYAEMIYAAIDELDENNGSNKTSISKYIESKYPNLPAGHTTLLRHHLAKMKDSGELIFWKNKYMKPNPNFIRRGRGRPPKPKGPDVPTSPYRHRARPKSDESETANPSGAVPPSFSSSTSSPAFSSIPARGGTGRPRGRPRKTPRPAAEGSSSGFGLGATGLGLVGTGAIAGGPRPRGRPPKAKPQATTGLPDFGFNV